MTVLGRILKGKLRKWKAGGKQRQRGKQATSSACVESDINVRWKEAEADSFQNSITVLFELSLKAENALLPGTLNACMESDCLFQKAKNRCLSASSH
jgi:hypothetical protein